VALGLPFNLWSAALFLRMLAQQCDLEPGELVWMGGDVHLYLNHADLVEAQIARTPAGDPGWTSRAGRIRCSTTASRTSWCAITSPPRTSRHRSRYEVT
jgi:hypothetical protein